jgi:hypothetical protein
MFKRFFVIAVLTLSVLTASTSQPSIAIANAKGKSTSSRLKTQRVKGYKTKAGTNVKSYTRAKAKRK